MGHLGDEGMNDPEHHLSVKCSGSGSLRSGLMVFCGKGACGGAASRSGGVFLVSSAGRASGGYQVTTTRYSPAGAPVPWGCVASVKVPSAPTTPDGFAADVSLTGWKTMVAPAVG